MCQGPGCKKKVPPEREKKGGKYCSEACAKKAYNLRRRQLPVPDKPYPCGNPECDKLVEPDPLQPEKKYCCPACKERANTRGRRQPKASLHVFCAQGRTYKEISSEYGWGKERIDAELAKPVEGYTLFRSRNYFYEEIFVFLPVIDDKIEVEPRVWEHRLQSDGEPYMMVQLPDDLPFDKVKIISLADIHRGAVGHDEELFLEYINWIATTPNVFVVVGGDALEEAYGDSCRGVAVYEQNERPQDARMSLLRILARIAHKILVAIPGNHERRARKSDFDPLEWIAMMLDIPYFRGPVWLDVLWHGHVHDFYIQHGETNSKTEGGKMNAAMAPLKWQDFTQFTLYHHVHDSAVKKVMRYRRDRVNFKLAEAKQYIVISPAFMNYLGTYAWERGMPPGAKGSVACELYANGDYHASS